MYYFENDLLEHFPRNISLESHYPLTKRQKQLLPTQEEFSSPPRLILHFTSKVFTKTSRVVCVIMGKDIHLSEVKSKTKC